MAVNEEELKNLLMRMKEESEKAGLKLNIQKIKIMAFGRITSYLSVVLGTEWNQRLRAGVGEAAGPRCHHQRLAFLFSHNKSRLLTAQEHTRVC